MLKIKFALGAILATAALTPAQAAWRIAQSSNFVIYSEEPEAKLLETVTNLEKFNILVRAFSKTNKPAAPAKVTIFQVRDMDAVRAALPMETYGIGGFFNTSAWGPFLVATRQGEKTSGTRRTIVDDSKAWGPEVLQHEYVHYLMYQYFPATYPSWYSEGFAEYYGTMQFLPNNVIEMGHAPRDRMLTIRGDWLPMKKMLTAKNYDDVGDQIGSLYAQGWLLTHYSSSKATRGTQLSQYLNGIVGGKSYEEAAKAAYGEDLSKLDDELKAHSKQLTALRISLKPMDVGSINIRELTPLETSLLRTEIKFRSGFPKKDLPLVASSVRSAVAASPKDPYGLRTLAHMELMAGNYDAAVKAADALMAINPKSADAHYVKGQSAVERMKAAKSTDTAGWQAAREALGEAIKISPNVPMFLQAYYDAHKSDKALPPASAQNALMRALSIIPSDGDLRYKIAADFEARDMIDEAIVVITPAALETNEGKDAEEKRRRQMREATKRFTGFVETESPRTMLARLEGKRTAKAAKPAAK